MVRREVHGVLRVEAAQVEWDPIEGGDDVVCRQHPLQRPTDVLGQLAIASSEQERAEHAALTEPVDGDDHLHVGEEGAQARRFGRPDAGGGEVFSHTVGLDHRVQRRAAALRGCGSDHIGHHLERPAVVRHEAERAAQFDDLLHPGCGEEIGERSHLAILTAHVGSRRHLPYDVDVLVWMDLEMTGLDHTSDVIVEIATIVTDDDLTIVAEGPDLVIHQPDEVLAAMDPFVLDMHTRSGLLEAIKASTISLDAAGAATLDFIMQHVPEPMTVPLCGNSIGTDRRFLAAYLPAIENHLHYRSIDVSSVKELVKRWYPTVDAERPHGHGSHRALDDIRESIREMAYYRDRVFVDRGTVEPGATADGEQNAHDVTDAVSANG